MTKEVKKVAVTGGGGQIGYSLIFRLAAGELLGPDQPIELSIHDIPQNLEGVVKGLVMELEDGCYPLLKKVTTSFNLETVFEGVDIALLVGAKPRGPGMERNDLLKDNGEFFQKQGKSLNCVAKKNALVFVVGNPCNTNCLIALSNAPNLRKENFHAMTRLDQNRSVFQLAIKAGVPVTEVDNVAVWGNHSPTLVPDFLNAKISEKPLLKSLSDRQWLEGEFFKVVQQRGAQVIKLRGKSSAASATQAILDGVKSILSPTDKGLFYSSGVISNHNPYNIQEGLIFSFPIRTKKDLSWEIVPDLQWDDFLEEKIRLSEKELIAEKAAVAHLL